MRQEEYFKCLFSKTREEQKQQTTQSLLNQFIIMFTQFHKQKLIRSYDNKFYALYNINSSSYGHYTIKQKK